MNSHGKRLLSRFQFQNQNVLQNYTTETPIILFYHYKTETEISSKTICIRMMKEVNQTCNSNVSKFFSITRNTIVNLYLIFELIT